MGTTNVNRSFQILTLTLSHPPPTNTSLGVCFEYEQVPIAIEKGGEYKIIITDFYYRLYFHRPSGKCNECRLNLLNLQLRNYRIRVRLTHRSWFTWSSSWRNVAGSSRQMIGENTEFPLDAILKEESDRSPVLRGFGRFSAFCARVWWEREVCESLTVGAFHLRKKPGNFGDSKSGISDW